MPPLEGREREKRSFKCLHKQMPDLLPALTRDAIGDDEAVAVLRIALEAEQA